MLILAKFSSNQKASPMLGFLFSLLRGGGVSTDRTWCGLGI